MQATEHPRITDALATSQTLLCLECGKCTANCPLTRFNGGYSPRRMIGRALSGDHATLLSDPAIWSCLGCGMCEARCPVEVDFCRLLQEVRAVALPERQSEPVCTHGGVLHSLMRLMATPQLQQNRRGWITDDLQVAEEGEVLLFVGCLPYFDAYFGNLGLDLLASARAAIKIMNRAGITPVVLAEERCCGHDLKWTGDGDGYRRLANHNVRALESSGAKTVVTTCAECYRTLAYDYPKISRKPGWNVRHMSELIAEKAADGSLRFTDAEQVVTYHDPCRLGRHAGVYDAPREVLDRIPALRRVEMRRSREAALCCGTSAWINCDLTSKKIQASRLDSAKSTGAETLVTCCPKCSIHFKCALQDNALAAKAGLRIRDLTVVAADALEEEPDVQP